MGYYETDKKNSRFFGLKLNYATDKDLIDKLLSVDSIQSYLKQLIRADIESDKHTVQENV